MKLFIQVSKSSRKLGIDFSQLNIFKSKVTCATFKINSPCMLIFSKPLFILHILITKISLRLNDNIPEISEIFLIVATLYISIC